METKIGIEITAKNNTRSGLNEARDDIVWTVRRINSEEWIKLSMNIWDLQKKMREVRELIKQAVKEWNESAEISLRADAARLQRELTQAGRELTNFARTWEKDVSVLGKLFDSVNGNIDRTRQAVLSLWGSTTAVDKLNARMDALQKEFVEWKISAQEFGLQMWKVNKELSDVEKSATWTQSSFSGIKNWLVSLWAKAFAVAGVAMQLNDARQQAMEFETGMANVNTIAQLSEKDLALLANQVSNISTTYGESRQVLTEGLYDIMSAWYDASTAINILDQSTKGAIAGNTSAGVIFGATSSIVKAYWLDMASSSQAINDLIFATNEAGQTTMEELAPAFQKTASISALAGLSLQEQAAVFMTLTGVTGNASEVGTQLVATLNAMIKPSSQAQELMKKYGIDMSVTAIKNKGLNAVLQEMQEKTWGNAEAMAILLGSTEALRAVSALAGNQQETFAKSIDKATESAWSQERAFEKNANTTERTTAKATESFNQMKIDVGNSINGMINDTIIWAWENASSFKWIWSVVVGFVKLMIAFGRDFANAFMIMAWNISSFAVYFVKNFQNISHNVGAFLSNMGKNLLIFAQNMWTIFQYWFEWATKAVSNGMYNVFQVISNVFTNIASLGWAAWQVMNDIGYNIVDGIMTAISNLGTMVYNAIADAIGSIPWWQDMLKNFGIKKSAGRQSSRRSVSFNAGGTDLMAGTKSLMDGVWAGPALKQFEALSEGMKQLPPLELKLLDDPQILKVAKELWTAKVVDNSKKGPQVKQKTIEEIQSEIDKKTIEKLTKDLEDEKKKKKWWGWWSKKEKKDENKELAQQAKDKIDMDTETQKQLFINAKKSKEDIQKLEDEAKIKKLEVDVQYAKTEEEKLQAKRKVELEKEKIETERIQKTQEKQVKSDEERKKKQEELAQTFVSEQKKMSDSIDQSTKKVQEHQKEITKIGEKWKETTAEARREIAKINDSIWETNFEADKKLADRFLKIEDEVKKKKEEIAKMEDWEAKKKAEWELTALQNEASFIQSNIWAGAIDKARTEGAKTESQKIVDQRTEDLKDLNEKKAITEAFAKSDLETTKIQVAEKDGIVTASYLNEEGKLVQIQDKKNIAYAEELLKKQTALQESLKVKQAEMDGENAIIAEALKQREALYKAFNEKIKQDNLNMIETLAEAQKKLTWNQLAPTPQMNSALNAFQQSRWETRPVTNIQNKNRSVNIGNVNINNNVDLDSLGNTLNSQI